MIEEDQALKYILLCSKENVVNCRQMITSYHECDVCLKPSCAYYLGFSKVTPSMTEMLYNANYTRVGRIFRKFDKEKACCQRIHTRLAVKDFKLKKNDKQVYRRFLNFLKGSYSL